MRETRSRLRGLPSLLLVIVAVVFTVFGLARGFWLENIHNALLAVTFTFVGAYVLFERPRHREGVLFLATGAVHAVMFLGRQLGHFSPEVPAIAGWFGVWPLTLALALTTFAVICFPDGRLPGRAWRVVAVLIVLDTALLSVLSAGWPVDYASVGVVTPHPLAATTPPLVETLWNALSIPSFIAFQLLWVVAVVARLVRRDGRVRRQLGWLLLAAGVSVALLVVGLLVWESPRAGILSATLLPLAAGWAIVRGQHAAAYSALSWLSRSAADPRDLPDVLARTLAESTDAARVTVWLGDAGRLLAVGTWPTGDDDRPPTTLGALDDEIIGAVQPVRRGPDVVGAISLERDEPLSRSEGRMFADLGAQAALVLDHLTLGAVIERDDRAGRLADLSPREREVLALIARGLSNTAICSELHLSIKTVEPIVSAVFLKLGLDSDAGSNRRVLAALEYQRSRAD